MSVAYPFAVLYHRGNILEVLKVSRVHRTKLKDFITHSEPLWKETTNYYNHRNKNSYFMSLNFKELVYLEQLTDTKSIVHVTHSSAGGWALCHSIHPCKGRRKSGLLLHRLLLGFCAILFPLGFLSSMQLVQGFFYLHHDGFVIVLQAWKTWSKHYL